jgi:hypothetical protein
MVWAGIEKVGRVKGGENSRGRFVADIARLRSSSCLERSCVEG